MPQLSPSVRLKAAGFDQTPTDERGVVWSLGSGAFVLVITLAPTERTATLALGLRNGPQSGKPDGPIRFRGWRRQLGESAHDVITEALHFLRAIHPGDGRGVGASRPRWSNDKRKV